MRNVQISTRLISELAAKQIVDITDQLPVNPLYTWAKLAGTRDINALTDIAWHHDAIAKSTVDDMTLATRIANNHIKLTKNEVKGDAGFPYHFWIRNGTIYQCNDVLDRTYGVGGNNSYTVHCCVSGEYSKTDVLSDADKMAMVALELTLRGVLPAYRQTQGHNYYNATECPGYSMSKFKEEVETVKQRIAFTDSEKGMYERAYMIANTILYTYNLALGKDEVGQPVSDGTKIWARQRLLLLEPTLKENGFIK